MKTLLIPISQIRESQVALRMGVDRKSESYLGLVESMRNQGFIGAISGRARQDPDTDEQFYEIIDGLQRFNAAKDAGIAEIPMTIVDKDDEQVLDTQILMNLHRVETKPSEYAAQLKRVLMLNPNMTEAELANRVGKSNQWIKRILGLLKVKNEQVNELINSGEICLTNACALSQLPDDEQPNWVDRALTDSPSKFQPDIQARLKEIRDAKRQGKDPSKAGFKPVEYMQKKSAITAELSELNELERLLSDYNVKDPREAVRMTLKWFLHVDPINIMEQEAKYNEREAEKERKRQERQKAKEEKAAEAAVNTEN